MPDYEMDPSQMVDFIRGVRGLLGNRRGPMSAAVSNIVDQAIDDIRVGIEAVARDTLESNLSEGPPLKQSWVDEKEEIWSGQRWFVSSTGMTFQVSQPPWAHGPHHKATFTGFLSQELFSWVTGGNSITNPPEFHVGYSPAFNMNIHPTRGMFADELAAEIHLGGVDPRGNAIPPRPYLNAQVSLAGYRNTAISVINSALQNLASTLGRHVPSIGPAGGGRFNP